MNDVAARTLSTYELADHTGLTYRQIDYWCRTEPELFTQDQANVGSAFTADKISYKVRHVFGGEVQEHRSFYRQVVAGS